MKFILTLGAKRGETSHDVYNRLDAQTRLQFLNLVHSRVRFDPHTTDDEIFRNRKHRLMAFTEANLLCVWPKAYEGKAYTRGTYYSSYFRHWHVCSHIEIQLDTLRDAWDITYIYLIKSQGIGEHWHLLVSFIHPKTENSSVWKTLPANHTKNPVHTNFQAAYNYLEYQAVQVVFEGGDTPQTIWRDEYQALYTKSKQAALAGEFGYDTNCYLRYLEKYLQYWQKVSGVATSTPAQARQESDRLANAFFFAGFVYEYDESQHIGPFINERPPSYEGQAVVCVINASKETIHAICLRQGWFPYPVYIVYTSREQETR
jgi:hypothetical protein